MSCSQKQLIINRFRLPDVILDIIKEFCFMDVVEKTKGLFGAVVQELNQFEVKYGPDDDYPHRTRIIYNENLMADEDLSRSSEICNICGKFGDASMRWRFSSKCYVHTSMRHLYANKIQCRCCDSRGPHSRVYTADGYERKIKLISHAGYFFQREVLPSKPFGKIRWRCEDDLELIRVLVKFLEHIHYC